MHCELDEPGYGVPFPHRKQKGFFAKLFSFACFGPSQTRNGNDPPSPFLMRTPTRPRPPSAKVTPPTLKLTSEMAPLRQSLASLKPGLAAAALADGSGGAGATLPTTAITLSEQQPRSSGGTPPTPHFGKMIAGNNNNHFPPRNRDDWITQNNTFHGNGIVAVTPPHERLQSEASFESLEAELSDQEGDGEVAMYRRTPVAGADGRPLIRRQDPAPAPALVPVRNNVSLEQMQQPTPQLQRQHSSGSRRAETAHAMELQAALIQALSVPLPPQNPAAGQVMEKRPSNGAAKQTQVTLAALMDPNNRHQQQRRYYQDIRSAPVSPQKRVPAEAAVNSKAPPAPAAPTAVQHQQQQQYHRPPVKSAPSSRAVSPLRQPTIKPRMTKASSARSEATQRLLEIRRKREMAHLANLHPRAAKRKEVAMLGHQQLSRGSSLNSEKSDEGVQVKRPRSADYRNEKELSAAVTAAAAGDGYQLPAAGTQIPAITKKQNSLIVPGNNNNNNNNAEDTFAAASSIAIPVPPRSPGFYQMLERLALGQSVDMERVKAAKKPTKTLVPMEEEPAVELEKENKNSSGSVVQGDGDFVFNPNALFSGNVGKAELSPLVNVAAQKLVSLSDAVVARSASGSVVTAAATEATKEEEEAAAKYSHPRAATAAADIAVDASSGTLLGQLMELERSLTLNDLAALRHAIRREGSEADVWTD
jgi:hypothetical protein